jgi:DNA-binding transcriptional LysR family regulator
MWNSIEFRELRVFLALAEELHFGRTAERIGVTQSRVSQSLRKLERQVGGQLVYRTSRHVELTTLGEHFRDDVAPTLERLDLIIERTRTASNNLQGRLDLGLYSGPSAGPRFSQIVKTFESQHPECTVHVIDLQLNGDFLEPLHRGEVDAITAWLPQDQADLVTGPILTRQKRLLAVARDHPLADRQRVSVEDIADYAVARIESLPDALIPTKTPSGRTIPHISLRGPFHSQLLAYEIAHGTIVHPTVSSVPDYWGHPDITYLPITDLPPAKSALVWRRRDANPRLREFIRVAREVLRQHKQSNAKRGNGASRRR